MLSCYRMLVWCGTVWLEREEECFPYYCCRLCRCDPVFASSTIIFCFHLHSVYTNILCRSLRSRAFVVCLVLRLLRCASAQKSIKVFEHLIGEWTWMGIKHTRARCVYVVSWQTLARTLEFKRVGHRGNRRPIFDYVKPRARWIRANGMIHNLKNFLWKNVAHFLLTLSMFSLGFASLLFDFQMTGTEYLILVWLSVCARALLRPPESIGFSHVRLVSACLF